MAQDLGNIFQTKIVNALDTYNHTAQHDSMYFVSVQATEIPPSGLSIAIKQNGSTKATSIAPTPTQGHLDLQIVLNCAANDVISIQLSSGSPSDTGPNAVKALLNIHRGSN